MNNLETPSQNTELGKKLQKSLPFVISALFHFGILILVGGIVLIHGLIPKSDFLSEIASPSPLQDTDEKPADIPQEETGGAELTPQETRSNDIPANLDLVTALIPDPSFTMPASSVPSGNISSSVFGKGGQGNGLGEGIGNGNGKSMAVPNLFGSFKDNGDGLKGIFYDFKVNADGTPTGLRPSQETAKLVAILELVMLQKKRDFSVYDRYFKAPNPLFRNIFIAPVTGSFGSPEAPKAFGVEAEGGMWMLYYSGYITPAQSGNYKFHGLADNMIALYLNQKVAEYAATFGSSRMDGAERVKSKDGWIRLRQGEPYFAEIFISDDGGSMYSRILVEKEGTPGLHIFQVGSIPAGLETALKQTEFKFNEVIFNTVQP